MKAKLWVWLAVVLAAVATSVVAGLAVSDTSQAARDATPARIGLVSDVGRFNDRSFNQSALEGLNRARRTLGVQTRAVESRAASDYIPNLATLARTGYVPISVGFLLAEATKTAAEQFPNSRFAIIDYSVRVPPFTRNRNVRGLTFATNENSYMIGCLAALMARQGRRPGVISAVGGIKLPTVDIFIAGYRAGARRCVPRTVVLIGYSQDFVAQDKCKEVALNQIARGSRVIFQVAGGCGLGALDAARERGRWGIGVDRDQKGLGRHILTSAVKRVDQSVFLTALAVKNGTFRGGSDATFNLKNAGVAVGRIDSRVPRAYIRRMNALRPLIISGRIRPPRTL
ncbi:MAG: BMP family ABC transporter substrate-binding protein [Actinomycetota bacterium]|nr:BMP family ABC transporter substrate-binding protein [Actinomycetota bacterium]